MDKETAAVILKNSSLTFSAFGYIPTIFGLCYMNWAPMLIGSMFGFLGLLLAIVANLLKRNQKGLLVAYFLNGMLILLPFLVPGLKTNF